MPATPTSFSDFFCIVTQQTTTVWVWGRRGGAYDPKFELWGDFWTVHLIARFHHPMFNRSEVTMLTNRQTNRCCWKHPPHSAMLRRWVKIVSFNTHLHSVFVLPNISLITLQNRTLWITRAVLLQAWDLPVMISCVKAPKGTPVTDTNQGKTLSSLNSFLIYQQMPGEGTPHLYAISRTSVLKLITGVDDNKRFHIANSKQSITLEQFWSHFRHTWVKMCAGIISDSYLIPARSEP